MMMSIVNKTAIAATLGLAALPWIALSVAHAQPATVQISDLTQGTPAQVETFNRRVDQAANQLCAGRADPRNLEQTAACKAAVHEEADAKFAEAKSGSMAVASR